MSEQRAHMPDVAPNHWAGQEGFISRKVAAGVAGVAVLLGGGAVLIGAMDDDSKNLPDAEFSASTDGMDNESNEFAWHIAGQGSCSPYTRADGIRASRGEFDPGIDLVDAEVGFLKDNKAFATNFANTSEGKIGAIYDALGVKRPSADTDNAHDAIKNVFDNEYYVTARLVESVSVQNTYCDDEGILHDYRKVNLEADTYVGGVMIKRQFTGPQGQNVTEFMNGKTVELPQDAIVAKVKLADGKEGLMYATNKAGISTDKDDEAEVGCNNVITAIPTELVPNPTTTTVPEEEQTTTTSPGRRGTTTTTTTTPNSTTTTFPDKQPVPLEGTMPHPQPGDGGSPENGMDPQNDESDGYDDEDREDVDPDGDGIHNTIDNCDSDAETFNGYRDGDGCPDTVPVSEQPKTTPTTGAPRQEAEPKTPTTLAPVDRDETPAVPTD